LAGPGICSGRKLILRVAGGCLTYCEVPALQHRHGDGLCLALPGGEGFYWHFRDRRALLEAALRCWEREQTEAVIDAMEAEPDLVRRLRRLFAGVTEGRRDPAELTLLAAAGDPAVAAALRRVTDRRISYMARVFEELGLARAKARSHALIAYNAYLGYLQLARAASEVLPRGPAARERYLSDLLSALLPAAPRENDAAN
jgi:AcrR family transcriptional regulator